MPEFLQHYYIEKPVGAVLTAHGRMNSPLRISMAVNTLQFERKMAFKNRQYQNGVDVHAIDNAVAA